ncbi:unnamed protein product [Chondrus crispus]|uniref:S1 motif domain-containing protein n=1 Tax=Chondrus crispus TaxID=2769 RepID=R7QNX0_CHOCR|nr:unnamed protein product [Chondrus crispus]CDF39794.1 unnamed protein product [Chondrus crispus]|eukprot:XP_005710088.1 unnamed protein product [Chondrus crispus]
MSGSNVSRVALFVPTVFLTAPRDGICRRAAFRCSSKPEEKAQAKPSTSRKKKRWTRSKAPPDSRPISEISIGEQLFGIVRDVGPAESSWLDVGVRTITGKAVRARLRLRSPNEDSAERKVGAVVPVYVHRVNHPAARIEVRKGTPPTVRRELEKDVVRLIDDLKVGEELAGEVVAVGSYGAVLDVAVFRRARRGRVVPRTGFLPRKFFKREWASEADALQRDDVERVIRVGDHVDVRVRAVTPMNGFFELSAAPVDVAALETERAEKRRNARRRLRRPPAESVVVGERRVGRVRETVKFGLFVDFGVKTDGLIHYSEMGDLHRSDWKEVINIGDQVTTEVLSVAENRIGLRLLYLGDEEIAEKIAAESHAASALARSSDVERATQLKTSSGSSSTGSVHVQVNSAESDSSADILNDNNKSPDDVANVEEEDDEDEGVEKFSDEYFEDKYGF